MGRVFTKEVIQELNVSALEFVHLAAKLARVKQISPAKAISMMENNEVTPEQIREHIIEDLQTQKPEPEQE